MNIYELVQCDLDENNHITDSHTKVYCSSTEAVWNYLTHNGKSHMEISVMNHEHTNMHRDKEYIKSCMDSPNATIKRHSEPEEMLGFSFPEEDEYFYVVTHEVFEKW